MSSYDFRQFQKDLAAIDDKSEAAKDPMAEAKKEFLELRKRHKLTVADVVAFFPEEEGIAYILSLMQQPAGTRSKK
jgi:hypothetical protein